MKISTSQGGKKQILHELRIFRMHRPCYYHKIFYQYFFYSKLPLLKYDIKAKLIGKKLSRL